MARERIINNNEVAIIGQITSDFVLNHEVFGEKFYKVDVSVKRNSGTIDIVPVMVSDRLTDISGDWKGKYVQINGSFRSYNKCVDGKNKLTLSVYATEFEKLEIIYNKNRICMDGYICKQPSYRETPYGREISDIILAVNRAYGKSDYIPCICWGRNARFAGKLEVGTHIRVDGRIQSREYQKQINKDECETRTAYEVSASRITVIEETEGNEHEEES